MWVLTACEIGMAMFAFAFGAYSVGLLKDVLDVAMPWFASPAISVVVVVSLIGVNLAGVREWGISPERIGINQGHVFARDPGSQCTGLRGRFSRILPVSSMRGW